MSRLIEIKSEAVYVESELDRKAVVFSAFGTDFCEEPLHFIAKQLSYMLNKRQL